MHISNKYKLIGNCCFKSCKYNSKEHMFTEKFCWIATQGRYTGSRTDSAKVMSNQVILLTKPTIIAHSDYVWSTINISIKYKGCLK